MREEREGRGERRVRIERAGGRGMREEGEE